MSLENLEILLIKNGGTLPLRQTLVLAIDVVAGLLDIHKAGLVYRDLKPSNILLWADEYSVMHAKLCGKSIFLSSITYTASDFDTVALASEKLPIAGTRNCILTLQRYLFVRGAPHKSSSLRPRLPPRSLRTLAFAFTISQIWPQSC